MEEAFVKECGIGIMVLLSANIRHISMHPSLTSEYYLCWRSGI